MDEKMNTSDRTLKEVFDALVEQQFIPQSRLGPMKAARAVEANPLI